MTVHFESIEKSGQYGFEVRGVEVRRASSAYRVVGKRALDIGLIFVSLPLLVPLVLLVSAVLLMNGHRPFYRQDRVGRDGRLFQIWKFRTMVEDAEEALAHHLEVHPDARAEWDVHQKLKNDPRVTAVGRFLRKTSLDELPQLWNVVRGEMSLVGPRPMLPEQQALYPSHAYYRLRPGITGFWQISDRNACEFKARATFDTLYEQELSLRTDLGVLWQTVAVVLRGTGY